MWIFAVAALAAAWIEIQPYKYIIAYCTRRGPCGRVD